jgi:5-methylcytosine-specific restriction enzyme A
MPKRFCMDCGVLFDKDDPRSPGLRCAKHQADATKRKNTDPPGRPSASQRGYGADWRRISAKVIAAATVCHWCGLPFTKDDPATADHVIPKAKGGTNDEQNLVGSHRSCNSRRAAAARRKKVARKR